MRLTDLNNLPLLGFETRQVAREAHTGTHSTTLTSFMGDVVQTMHQCKEAPWSRGIYELDLEGCIGAYFSPHSLSIYSVVKRQLWVPMVTMKTIPLKHHEESV